MLVKSEHSSDAGHWYHADTGEPAYTIQKSDGTGVRNTTLRDARKLNLVPSVTTILAQLNKAGLQPWLNQQLLLSALTLPRNDNEPEAQWLERVLFDSRETGRKAAERGTAVHAIIETYFENEVYIPEYPKYVYECEQTLDNALGLHKWVAEQSFAHKLRYGGKCDLYAPADPTTDFPGACIDVKTKETNLDKIKAYDEWIYQLAAYREGLGMPNAICGNLLVNANTNEVRLIIHDPADISDGWSVFCHLLRIYQIKNKL